jgi:hypothetical protein
MLLKPFTAFALGAVTVASSISAALDAPGRFGFIFGVLSTFLLIALFLRSPRRAGWVAKLLLRIAGPSEVVLKVKQSQAKAVKLTESSKTPRIRKADNPVFTDVVLALRGLKTDIETARWATGQAIMRLPDSGFDETFKLAVQIATARA